MWGNSGITFLPDSSELVMEAGDRLELGRGDCAATLEDGSTQLEYPLNE